MGLFLSSSRFWFVASSLFGAGRPFFAPSPAIRFAERAEGVKGPKRSQSLAACRLALLVFRSALRPEHAEDDELRRGFFCIASASDPVCVC
jgi:hypothetical protein